MKDFPVIAVDGPAGSGKTSVSRRLAERLGWTHVDSGAMYRILTWYLREHGVDPSDRDRIVSMLDRLPMDFRREGRSLVFRIAGLDPGEAIRSEEVTGSVSAVAAIPEVRDRLVSMQRALTREGPIVMEGRDIGTVVFPGTPWKFYLDARPEIRADRRRRQMREAGGKDVLESIRRRDDQDSSRPVSPMRPAEDAVIIDTSSLSLEEVVDRIMNLLAEKGLPEAAGR